VEDNEVNQRVAVGMLAKLGFRADVAANGLEAVDAVAKFAYGAVLMDCQMPLMDGYAATAEIREREAGASHVPIVAMTAAAMTGERERCLAAGMDDYVSKPVQLGELRKALSRWVEPVEDRNGDDVLISGAAPSRAAFDPTVVAALRSLRPESGADAFDSLTQLFVASGAALMGTLREALAREDLEAVGSVAHTMKGSAANLGALRLADACGELEQALAAGVGAAGADAARVEAEFELVRAWLRVA
jgi:CheY-like chemotaxis protein/HPt (histidine-containing phosphotransfer) domain-containing protein